MANYWVINKEECINYSFLVSPDIWPEGTYVWVPYQNNWYIQTPSGLNIHKVVGNYYWKAIKANKVPKEYQAMALLLT